MSYNYTDKIEDFILQTITDLEKIAADENSWTEMKAALTAAHNKVRGIISYPRLNYHNFEEDYKYYLENDGKWV